jgi:hypothetical protein
MFKPTFKQLEANAKNTITPTKTTYIGNARPNFHKSQLNETNLNFAN